MHLDLVTVRQDINLKQRLTANYLVLQLPNGKIINALVEDDVVKDIMILIAADGGRMEEAIPSSSQQELQPARLDDGTPVMTFGGPPSGVAPALHDPLAQELDAPEPYRLDDNQAPPPPRKFPRKVQADAKGNPIVEGNGVNTDEYLGDDVLNDGTDQV